MAQKDDTIPDELRVVIQRMINAHEPEEAIASVIRAHRNGTLKLDASGDIPSTGPSKEPYGPKKPNEYTGPDTFWGGFGQSMKQGGEGYNRMMDSFKGFDKGAILDIPETIWGGMKLGGQLATGQKNYIDVGRDIWGGLKRVPDALRHSGENPENAENWGRGLGQVFGQPAVMEAAHEYGPPTIRAASKPISKVGDILHEYQPLSGFLPKSLSMRSLRNFERFTGGALQKIGEKAADFGLTPAQINAKALEDWNRLTSDQSGGSKEAKPTFNTPKPDIWDTMLGENRPKTSEEILREWERLTGNQSGGSKEAKPTFRKPDKDIWDTLLMEERTPEPPKTSPLGTAMTEQFKQKINPGQTISPEQSGLGPIERGQGQLPFDRPSGPSNSGGGGGQGELGIEPPPEWLKSQAEIEALQARLRELLEKNPNIGTEPPSVENPPSTEVGPRRILLDDLKGQNDKIKALKRDGYLFKEIDGKGWLERAPTTVEMVEEAQSSPKNEKKGKKGGKEPGPETSKDEFVPSEDWKQTYTNLRNMLGRDPSAAEIEAAMSAGSTENPFGQNKGARPGESTGNVAPFQPTRDKYQKIANEQNITIQGVPPEKGTPIVHDPKLGGFQSHRRGNEEWVTHPSWTEPHGPFKLDSNEAVDHILEYQDSPEFEAYVNSKNKNPSNVAPFENRSNDEILIRRTTDPTELQNLDKHWYAERVRAINAGDDAAIQHATQMHERVMAQLNEQAHAQRESSRYGIPEQSQGKSDQVPPSEPQNDILGVRTRTTLGPRTWADGSLIDDPNAPEPYPGPHEGERPTHQGPFGIAGSSDRPRPIQSGQQELPWSRGENPQPIDADEIGRIRSAAAQRLMSAPHDIGPVQQSMMPDFGDAEIQNYLKNEDARPPEMNDINTFRPPHSPDKISFMQKLKDMLDQEEYA